MIQNKKWKRTNAWFKKKTKHQKLQTKNGTCLCVTNESSWTAQNVNESRRRKNGSESTTVQSERGCSYLGFVTWREKRVQDSENRKLGF